MENLFNLDAVSPIFNTFAEITFPFLNIFKT